MRKLIMVGVIGLSFLILLTVSATPPTDPTGPAEPIWTVRFHNAHGLAFGDVVEEAGTRIGQVVSVSEVGGEPRKDPDKGLEKDVVIMVNEASQERLCERSAFFVRPAVGGGRPVLELVVFDDTSPHLPPGSLIIGAESETEVEVRRQMFVMEGAVHDLAQGLQVLSKSLNDASRSKEKKELEDSMVHLFESLEESKDEVTDILTKELERWKEIFDKLAADKKDKPTSYVF